MNLIKRIRTGTLLACAALFCAVAAPSFADEEITADSFKCLSDMTKVRHFYVDNLNGDLEATVAVANSSDGGVYPEGSVVQLVPGEAMIKRSAGFSPVTKDWEFFELDVSADGAAIRKRGFADVVNRFGGNCFACHIKAEPQWDLLCDNNHGCDPIPLTRSIIATIQKTDPRCEPTPLTDEDRGNLKAIQAMMQPQAADQ